MYGNIDSCKITQTDYNEAHIAAFTRRRVHINCTHISTKLMNSQIQVLREFI